MFFGHTVQASSIVLASYFVGLAIGNWIGAGWSTKVRPLIGYALAELIIAIWAILIPLLLGLTESEQIAPWLSSSSIYWQTGLRAAFSFLLLLPATTAMGATLPFIAEYFSKNESQTRDISSVSSPITLCYALNTAGALAGTLLTTFYLLIIVGVRSSGYLAGSISLICAFLTVMLHCHERRVTILHHSSSTPSPSANVRYSSGQSGALGVLRFSPGLFLLSALGGFVSLALQVLYNRMFSLVFHNSTYTFGIVIAVFLTALTLGAGLASVLQRYFRPKLLLGLAIGLGSIATVFSVIVFVWQTELNYFKYGTSFHEYIFGATLLVCMVIGPAITCFGMVLPLVWRMVDSTVDAGFYVGRLTAINTLAAAIGAASASFILLPLVGLWNSIVALAILFFIAAFVLLWNEHYRITASVIALALGVVSVFAVSSPIESMSDREKFGEILVRRWNSAYGWIDIVQLANEDVFKIRQNLHYRFGKTGTRAREFRQANVPLLLHPNPQDVLFMGLGTGLTAGGAVPHPQVKQIVAVELIPEVAEAVRLLASYNNNVVDDPKTKVAIDDARHYLLAHRKKYDLIISDLFVPWESKSGYLYTVENYRVAENRLKDDGLFCQWLPLYQLGPQEFESIANSFAKIFPETTIWWSQIDMGWPVIALIGSKNPIQVGSTELDRRLERLKLTSQSFKSSIPDSTGFKALYLGDWIFDANRPLNTDEHPLVEFSTPVSNRNRTLLQGSTLDSYFKGVLGQLPKDSVKFDSDD